MIPLFTFYNRKTLFIRYADAQNDVARMKEHFKFMEDNQLRQFEKTVFD